MSLKLRPYQEKLIQMLREKFASGYKRVICYLATGGGKTATFTQICHNLIKNDKIVLILVRRRELVFQTAKAIEKFTGHKSSICMGNEKGFDSKNKVQICSIDTITRRSNSDKYKLIYNADYIIVDECHDSTSPKYRTFLNHFKDKYWIGFTATPFNTGNKYLEDWQDVVKPVETAELRDDGYLVEEKTYAPAKIDISDIKTRGGDYDQKSLAQRASESRIVGDIVNTWTKYGENRPTILFAVNKDHSRICAEAFRQNGIAAISQDESHTTEERNEAIRKLKSGEIKVLCNVNIFSTGVDIPQVSCGIFARPTKSEILYVQQVGRVLRPYKKCSRCKNDCGAEKICSRCGGNSFSAIKRDAILLDHANNCERFGLAFDPRPARIKPQKTKTNSSDEEVQKTKTCANCYAVYEYNLLKCPHCEHENESKKRDIIHEEGELKRIQKRDLEISKLKQSYNKYYSAELNFNLKPAFKYFQLYRDHGELIFEYSKELELPRWLKSVVRQMQKKGQLPPIKM